jgi:hypothetical protein
LFLAVVSGDGKAYFSTNRNSRGRSAAEDHRGVFPAGELADICDQHCQDDQPAGWSEPRQTPEFDEYTEGAEYIAVWLPAFSPQTVHRDQ